MRRIAYILSLILIFAIPSESSIELPGFGSGVKLIGILVAAVWLPSVLYSGRLRKLQPFHFATFALFTWAAFSILWSWDSYATQDHLITFLQMAIFIVLLWDLYITPHQIEAGLQAFVFGGMVSAVAAIVAFISDTNPNVDYATRYVAPGFDPNEFGILLALGVAMAWYLANQRTQKNHSRILQTLNYAFIPLGTFSALLTASRTTMLALALIGAYIFFSLRARRLVVRIAVFFFLIGSLYWLQTYIPETTFSRLDEVGKSLTSGDLTGRGEIWRQGIVAFSEHPILGVGAGSYRSYIYKNMVSHNVPLAFAAELGIIGLALYGLVLAFVCRSLLIIMQSSRRNAFFWGVLFLVWFLGSLTLNLEVHKITWFLFTFIACSSIAYVSQESTSGTSTAIPLSASVNERRQGVPTLSKMATH